METFRQFGAVTAMGLKTIPARLGPSLVIVLGMACAVGAFISILSMSTGLTRSLEGTGRADRAVVLSQGSLYEFGSSLSRENAATIADAPGIRKTAAGKPIVSAEPLAYAVVKKKSDGLDIFLIARGIGPQGPALRPEIRMIRGRMFQPGKYELIVGKSAQALFAGLDPGKLVALPGADWTVTGIFDSGGNVHESELITDSATLYAALRASNYKSMTVMLDSPAALSRFKHALTTNPTLAVDVTGEPEFFARQEKFMKILLTVVAYVVGGIMGLGAMFGALNTMYSAVSTRTREIATLRAIGFGGGVVVASVLAESLLLTVAGAVLGAAVAWGAFNGNLHTMGNMVISLAVTPSLAGYGIAFACALGLIGGLFPGIRAARRPVATALRATI
jgi:putative ABC transport system permease protein